MKSGEDGPQTRHNVANSAPWGATTRAGETTARPPLERVHPHIWTPTGPSPASLGAASAREAPASLGNLAQKRQGPIRQSPAQQSCTGKRIETWTAACQLPSFPPVGGIPLAGIFLHARSQRLRRGRWGMKHARQQKLLGTAKGDYDNDNREAAPPREQQRRTINPDYRRHSRERTTSTANMGPHRDKRGGEK